jgi:hypothetical protein
MSSSNDPWKLAGEAVKKLPPADFSGLVQMLSAQALVALGKLPHPASGKSDPQPAFGKHLIELLSVLETKTRGNLDPQESAALTQALHLLRLTYVEATRS